MLRTVRLTLVGLALTGCNRGTPLAPPLAETKPAATTAAPSAAAPPSATSTAPASPPPPVASSSLRNLVASYLESDGQGSWHTNEQAATELEKLGPDELAQLWSLLKDPQVEVRRGAAVFLLTQFDAENSDHVVAFAALLGDSDRMVRARALDAVRQFAQPDKIAALPRLAVMLDSAREDRAENRTAAARLCGSVKTDAAPALPALESAAGGDSDARVRAAAVAAIAQIATPEHAIASLSKALADRDASVRLVAAARLRQLGPSAAPASKALAAALADGNTDVAEAAAEALIRIGAPSVESLAGQLTSSSTSARRLALACLVKLGPAAKPAAAGIENCSRDADPQVRRLAETALKNLAGK